MASRTVQASISFLQWQDLYEVEKPFQIFIDIPEDAEDQRDTNLVFQRVYLTVHDVRGIAAKFSLDSNGFKYRRHIMKTTNFADRKNVEQSYLPEIEELLKTEVEGADRVFFFDWRVSEKDNQSLHLCGVSLSGIQLRKNAPEVEGAVVDMNDLTNWLRPAVHVHVGTISNSLLF